MTTIYDIAKKVGCAPSTVSKHITKHGYVSQAMGKKIATAMQELNYHYNGIARALSTSTSNRIGIVVPFLDHPYFQGLVNAISEALAKAGKEVVIFPTRYAIASEQRALSELVHHLIDGLIITSHALPRHEINKYQVHGTIVFCESSTDPAIKSVEIDRATAMTDLFLAFKKRRLTRLGLFFIRRPENSVTTTETLATYHQVFNCHPAPDFIRYHCRNFADGQKAARQMLAAQPAIQAILTESDISAAGAQQEITRQDKDIQVAGQGNHLLSSLLNFSSIDQHLPEIGQQAVDLVLDQADNPQKVIKFNFIDRI